MTYELEFDPRALKEWHKLGDTVKAQFKKKLADVLLNPRIDSARLNGLPDCYKIEVVTVFVVAVGKRQHSAVYLDANKRL